MNRRTAAWSALAVLAIAGAGAAADTAPRLAKELDEAVRTYDLTRATVVLAQARDAVATDPAPDGILLQVRASLAVAELLRIRWEGVPEAETARRRELGSRIDAVAREGLAELDRLPSSSERERLRADLLATLIRSDYRARKHEKDFKGAVAAALELDEGNARAWVSAAKPYLFASPEHGGDLEESRRLLERALQLEPELEPALLLRALANERLGDAEAARADLELALENNPDCTPARDALDRIGRDSGQ
jgi:tetratricopeptide (TPR) repeat protein